MIRVGIIGIGRQGSKYAKYFFGNKIEGAILTSLCDIDEDRFAIVDSNNKCNHFNDYIDLIKSNTIDAVIIDTPHYLHPIITSECVKNNINVLSDKPLGVIALNVKKIGENLGDKKKTVGVLFNQRHMPVFKRIKEVINNHELGELKRCVWEITDWYRPQQYYNIGGWRSTWKGEGGGVLINQCVHNIDMICNLFGRPNKINSNIGYGVYHRTEVDDTVVANLIYDNGFVCTLISSTGETPGTNRLEISGTKGKLVFDSFDRLKYTINEIPEDIFSKTNKSERYELKFGKPKTSYYEELITSKVDSHLLCIIDYINAIKNGTRPMADYYDGLACVETINAIYYSDWTNKTVTCPIDELKFQELLINKYREESSK